jgi:phosphoribosylamine--glycine ligase
MKILIIGSGGREHAIAWKVSQNEKVETIYVAPGNGGTAIENKCKNVNITEIKEFVKFAKENNIDLTIVGPEEPLINGIVDTFKAEGLKVFGPAANGAKLEGSKIFSKDFMKKYNVKTAAYGNFYDLETATEYLKTCDYPVVIKADGIAAGKGVVIVNTFDEGVDTLKSFMIDDIFNGSGKQVVIEEFLVGVEASILSITDGNVILPFISAKDHKQIFDNNEGPNTGGMGAISPNPYVNEDVLEAFNNEIMARTLTGIKEEKMDFTGIIFFGIMITKKGVYLLEYNVRMGDPETQAVLTLMESDLVELIESALKGNLKNFDLKWNQGAACCVVAASKGYPGKYEKGKEISLKNKDGKVFIAGAKEENGKLLTNGGRVLSLVNNGKTLEEAMKKAYANLADVNFEGIYYRKDIGSAK